MGEKVEVKVGQIWEDCDKRMYGRLLRVTHIVGDYAFCDNARGVGRSTKIALRRFRPNSTGFRLVSQPGDGNDRTPERGWRLLRNDI